MIKHITCVTQDSKVEYAIDSFAKQYLKLPDDYKLHDGRDPKEVYKELTAVENPTADQVNSIIGNESWTSVACDYCYGYHPAVACFTSWTKSTNICKSCLRQALELL